MHTFYIELLVGKQKRFTTKAKSIREAFANVFDMRGCDIIDTYLINEVPIARVTREDNENGNMLWCATYSHA